MDDEERHDKRAALNWKKRKKYRQSGKFKDNIQTFYSSDHEERPVKKNKRNGVISRKNVDCTINPEGIVLLF